MDVFQLLDPAAPVVKDQDVAISGPNCPNRPSSDEFSMVEVDSQIHKVLDLCIFLF
jgi:hypothetical protein